VTDGKVVAVLHLGHGPRTHCGISRTSVHCTDDLELFLCVKAGAMAAPWAGPPKICGACDHFHTTGTIPSAGHSFGEAAHALRAFVDLIEAGDHAAVERQEALVVERLARLDPELVLRLLLPQEPSVLRLLVQVLEEMAEDAKPVSSSPASASPAMEMA
jgi:hypothetical protein